MPKVINIKPAEEIMLIDPISKEEYHGYFNMRCLLFFQQILKDLNLTVNGLQNTFDLPAMCLYSVLNTDREVSYEDSCKMSERMGPASSKAIVNMFMESLSESMDDEQRDLIKKEMARHVMNLKTGK